MTNILVVDDEPNIQELVKLYLEKEGYRVELAGNGGDAIKRLESFKPALVVWGQTPAMVLWGYAGMALIFLVTLLLVYKLCIATLWRVVIFCASIIVMIPLHLLWIAIFRLATSFIG